MLNFIMPGFHLGVRRSYSDLPPAHYTQKIDSFSFLRKHSVDGFESATFEAGGYKWKLVIYPKGNKKKNVKDHISVYLVMDGENSLISLGSTGWEVYVDFRVFLLNQNKGTYLVLQDDNIKQKCFHKERLEVGIDKLISLKEFTYASNGYLMDDTCEVGAQVFVYKERRTAKVECVSRIENYPYKYVWKVEKFSALEDKSSHVSEPFTVANQEWKIQLHPKGYGEAKSPHIAIFLQLANPEKLPPDCRIYTDFSLSILNTNDSERKCCKANHWFSASSSSWGWPTFIALDTFNLPNKGFLVNDTFSLEAEVTIHGIANLPKLDCSKS